VIKINLRKFNSFFKRIIIKLYLFLMDIKITVVSLSIQNDRTRPVKKEFFENKYDCKFSNYLLIKQSFVENVSVQ